MNLVTQEKTKELTDQQKTFLNALFGEANGSPKLAGEIAGYSEHSYPKVVICSTKFKPLIGLGF